MIVLGIETSCDETAVAAVRSDRRILAERVLSQAGEHRAYGGVVPEIAARSHLDHLDRLIALTMAEARLTFPELGGIAVTGGPGLIGGVIVGVMTAKAIAAVHALPFVAVNHLEGHALTARLTDDVAFPYLLLLVSGGHCQLLVVDGVGRYRRLGGTLDDAAGEAFDKVAKLLGLGYPGGPEVERWATRGDPARFDLPRPMLGRPGLDFSFSGLKTAVRHLVESQPELDEAARADIAATVQERIAEHLADRTRRALARCRGAEPGVTALVVAGGVAANRTLRERLAAIAGEADLALIAPPARLCTDNAAMIAWAGIERLGLGLADGLDFAPRPRWPLDPDATGALAGLDRGRRLR